MNATTKAPRTTTKTVALYEPVHAALMARWEKTVSEHHLSFVAWCNAALVEALGLEEEIK